MKRKLKSLIAALAVKLPWGGRRAVLDALVEDVGSFEFFRQLGHRLNVKEIRVTGANGLFWGMIDDVELMGHYAETGRWAEETIDVFRTFFRQCGGGTFLDIGANMGLTLVPIAQDPRVKCFGFEPEPANFSRLKANVEANCRADNTVLRQIALFDKATELEFELSPINSGDHRVRVSTEDGMFDEAGRETILIRAERLDNIMQLDDLKRPLAIKMDAQGAEPTIFAGGPQVLAAADLMSIEYTPYTMRRIGGDVLAELRFLADHFTEGSISPGDKASRVDWCPISDVVAELSTHWEDPNLGARYFDVLVRK